MRVLGLDLSTKAGIAVVDNGKVVFAHEAEFKKERGWQRVSSIVGKVVSVHEEYKPDMVVIEALFIGHTSSAVVLAEINTVLRFYLWQECIEYIDVPATTLKKFMGKGNFKKDEMRLAVYKQFAYEHHSDNVIDAVALAMFGGAWAGDVGVTQAQKVVIGSVFNPVQSIAK